MIFQPDRYLLKKQIKKYSYFIRGSILDAGSGDGERYKKYFNFDKYVTLDIDSAHKADINGSVEDIPIDSEIFDSVISTQVLEHVKNPQKAIEEFYRVLKHKGHCLITIPQLNELHEEPNDYFRFTKFGIEELLHKAGFKIILTEKRGGFWALNGQIQARYIIDLFKLNKHRWIRKFLEPILWLNGKFYLYLDVIDRSNANSKHAIGWLIIAQK